MHSLTAFNRRCFQNQLRSGNLKFGFNWVWLNASVGISFDWDAVCLWISRRCRSSFAFFPSYFTIFSRFFHDSLEILVGFHQFFQVLWEFSDDLKIFRDFFRILVSFHQFLKIFLPFFQLLWVFFDYFLHLEGSFQDYLGFFSIFLGIFGNSY